MKTESQMNVVRNGLIVAALSALVGCANAYRVSSGNPVSRVSVDLATDSDRDDGQVVRRLLVPRLVVYAVERGWVVARTSHLGTAANSENLGTASFTPEAGKAYRASFAVRRQSNSCDLKIEDDSNTRVSYATPADSCYQGQLAGCCGMAAAERSYTTSRFNGIRAVCRTLEAFQGARRFLMSEKRSGSRQSIEWLYHSALARGGWSTKRFSKRAG